LLLVLLGACGSGDDGPGPDAACSLDYWVSTTGSDGASGAADAPFRTLERARLAVRQDPSRGLCRINVNVRPGTYALAAPLVFDALDSGSPGARVVYRAAVDNEAPAIISGGVPVGNFGCTASSLCTANVSGLPAGAMPRQFYVNGQRAVRARSNDGAKVNANYVRVANGYAQILPEPFAHPELLEAVTVTQWKMMRCPVASLSGNTLVMQSPCWHNANTYASPWNFQLLSWLENAPEFVTQPNTWFYDPYSRQLTYFNTGAGAPKDAVLPVLETLVELKGSAARPVEHISFQGLQFSFATWLEPNGRSGYVSDQSGYILKGEGYEANSIGHQQLTYRTQGNVTLQYARHIAFEGNTFSHLGGVALSLDTGSQDNLIEGNTFVDISSSALQVGGLSPIDARPTAAQATLRNVVRNNGISHTGVDYYDSAGILVGFTSGTLITRNTIRHTPWSSIAIGWGWGLLDSPSFPGLPHATPGMWGTYATPTVAGNNEISSNLFEHFLEQLWDGGAIYTNGSQGPDMVNGLLIRLNVARNKRPAAGSNIYYTDGGSRFVTLQQNVSLDNPVGTVDFGPCLAGSSISPLCVSTGVLAYGADFGGCLPVGNLAYIENYFLNPIHFFGPELCRNTAYIPAYPVGLTIQNNVPTTSADQVPAWILSQAGRDTGGGPKPAARR